LAGQEGFYAKKLASGFLYPASVLRRRQSVLIVEQSLDKLGDHPDGANQNHCTPKVITRRTQMICVPDNVQRAEKTAPMRFMG
jgi:hypothetical protein